MKKHTHALDDSDLPDRTPDPSDVVAEHLKAFSSMPGPKGWPVVGTLWDYVKKDGFKFNKMFEVIILIKTYKY